MRPWKAHGGHGKHRLTKLDMASIAENFFSCGINEKFLKSKSFEEIAASREILTAPSGTTNSSGSISISVLSDIIAIQHTELILPELAS